MWRPENWKNPYSTESDSDEVGRHFDYEAGADAMLNSLTLQGRYININTYIDYPQLIASIGAQNKKGYIVFIEES